MKSLKKLFSAAIASAMLISCFAINAFAQDSVATLAVDKTEVAAGDVVTVTLNLDQTKGLANVKYTIEYPTDVFTIDTVGNEDKYLEYEEEYDVVPNYFDADWYYSALDNAGFLKKLNTVVYGPGVDEAETGKIILSASAVSGTVTSSTKGFDVVIGQFYLTVKDGAKAGDAVISVTGANADADLTVGTIAGDEVTVKVAGGGDEGVTRYFEATVAGNDATGFAFDVEDETAGLTATTDTFEFDTDVVTAESVTVGLVLKNAPVDNVINVLAKLVF